MSPQIVHPVVGFFRVASVILLVVAVGLLAAITTMHFAIHGAEVQVPTLKGMTVADARSQAAGLGLNLDVDNRYFSSDVAAGHILTQSPAPGTVVRREWHVRVAESLGPQQVDVPDTIGMDEHLAALKLRRVGLTVGATARLPNAKIPEGTVLAQDPPAHAKGIEGPSINLLVAAPPDVGADGFLMPDLKGMTLESAQTQLAHVGLTAAPPTFMEMDVPPVGPDGSAVKPPVAPNTVILQQPQPGARVDANTLVRLTVAR
ncbi:PASTA domain-containing protein [Terracidiphilus sp.]|jgi:beta-lactam-binding protein with PASTA domain|uniref:PASTA domain-containing protein n=1 Tax=Terracidiphilus sp. TaxID=1964191 RepID=UPI003C15C82E